MANSSRDPSVTVLITGASSGIGEALALRFAATGHRLVLVARSAEALAKLAKRLNADYGVEAIALPADLAQPGAAGRILATLKRRRWTADILVNNAGVLAQGSFADMPAERHRQIIDLNIGGLTAMLSAFVPGMIERAGKGRPQRILNVASIASFQPVPMLATYAASKAYVLSLSESLAEELRGTGVSVTTLCPGITATRMLASAAAANAKLGQIPGVLVSDVETVAREAYDACMAGEVIRVPGLLNRAAMIASRSAPKWLVRSLGGLFARSAL